MNKRYRYPETHLERVALKAAREAHGLYTKGYVPMKATPAEVRDRYVAMYRRTVETLRAYIPDIAFDGFCGMFGDADSEYNIIIKLYQAKVAEKRDEKKIIVPAHYMIYPVVEVYDTTTGVYDRIISKRGKPKKGEVRE